MKTINNWLFILTICAALTLGFTYFANVLLLQDGGWYTYPSYSMLMGGDPSENIPGYVIPHQHPGITAKFIWENRTNLFVLHQLAGLDAFGDNWKSIRIMGALEWLSIAFVAAFVTEKLTRSRQAALVVGAFVVSDSILIASALSNARPDVVNALLGILGLGSIEWIRRNSSNISLIPAIAIAVALPLIHVTSAIAIALLGFYIILCIKDRYGESKTIDANILKLGLIGAILCITYLLRNPILEHLIPTNVPQQFEEAGRHNLISKLAENFSHGGEKLAMEFKRWFAYFFIKNLSHLAFLSAGLALVIFNKQTLSDFSVTARRITLALIAAVLFQLLTDPHPTSSHLIVIMVFGYVAAGLGWHAYMQQNHPLARTAVSGLAVILVATVALKIGQSYKLYRDYAATGFTNAKVEEGLATLITSLPPDIGLRIYGPTELWPYLTGLKRQITILDTDRTKLPSSAEDAFADNITLLAINEDYWNSGWEPLISEWLRMGKIRSVLQFGKCSPKSACLNLYQKIPAN